MSTQAARDLAQRRSIRPLYAPETSLAELLDAVRREARRAPGAKAAWAASAPQELKDMAQVIGLVQGVLTLRARDASAHWEVDQWLRREGKAMLLSAASAPIRRIKLVK